MLSFFFQFSQAISLSGNVQSSVLLERSKPPIGQCQIDCLEVDGYAEPNWGCHKGTVVDVDKVDVLSQLRVDDIDHLYYRYRSLLLRSYRFFDSFDSIRLIRQLCELEIGHVACARNHFCPSKYLYFSTSKYFVLTVSTCS
jgi:hypothetical protein